MEVSPDMSLTTVVVTDFFFSLGSYEAMECVSTDMFLFPACLHCQTKAYKQRLSHAEGKERCDFVFFSLLG